MRRSVLLLLVLLTMFFVACAATQSIERVCELNEAYAALNERTIPDIESDPCPEPALLEENFVEGVRLMRDMVEVAPSEVRADLEDYVEAITALSGIYSDFGYDRCAVTQEARDRFGADHKVPDEMIEGIQIWFLENCGLNLQG